METPFASYTGADPYVFVCYSHADKALVYPELARLRDAGFHIWYDEGIRPGSEWSDILASRIEGCAAFLYFVTPRSATSEHCRREVNFALDQPCTLLAVHLEPTELPGGLKLTLNNRQAILKHRFPSLEYERRMVDALTAALTRPGSAPTAPPAGMARPAPQPESGTDDQDQPSIAVLPFTNMSRDPDQEYFSDGISEDILDALSRNRSLIVRARESSFRFKGQPADPGEVARQLNVAYLVGGSVRVQGPRVRVTARLTDVAANQHVWSNRYDRELTDIFAIQDEISESIARELGAHFSKSGRQAVAFPAYDAFLLGRHYYNRFDFEAAGTHLQKAIELDPDYADALALLARVYATQIYNSPPDLEAMTATVAALVDRTLARDPEHSLARGLRAMTLPIQAAIDELDALIRQYPNDEGLLFFYSTRMRHIARGDLELALLDRRVALDPLSPAVLYTRGFSRLKAGRLDSARADFVQAEALGLPAALPLLQIALLEHDMPEAKRQAIRPDADWLAAPLFWKPIHLALMALVKGDRPGIADALAPLRAQRSDLPRYPRHYLALLEGDLELALDLFASALQRGEPFAYYEIHGSHLNRTLFPDFFSHPRYQAIVRAVGLDAQSTARLSIPPLPFERG